MSVFPSPEESLRIGTYSKEGLDVTQVSQIQPETTTCPLYLKWPPSQHLCEYRNALLSVLVTNSILRVPYVGASAGVFVESVNFIEICWELIIDLELRYRATHKWHCLEGAFLLSRRHRCVRGLWKVRSNLQPVCMESYTKMGAMNPFRISLGWKAKRDPGRGIYRGRYRTT